MSEHLTIIRKVNGRLLAHCPEHGAVAPPRDNTRQGFNATVTEARAHDDKMHKTYRTDKQYRIAIDELG